MRQTWSISSLNPPQKYSVGIHLESMLQLLCFPSLLQLQSDHVGFLAAFHRSTVPHRRQRPKCFDKYDTNSLYGKFVIHFLEFTSTRVPTIYDKCINVMYQMVKCNHGSNVIHGYYLSMLAMVVKLPSKKLEKVSSPIFYDPKV